MKSTILFALFLVCAFTISYLPSATAQFVLDTDDDPLQNGGTYYMLPVMRGKGGGIEVDSTGKQIETSHFIIQCLMVTSLHH